MGYRSTVAYTIRFLTSSYNKPEERTDPEEAKRSFYTFLAEAKSKPETALCFLEEEKDYFKVDEQNLAMYFFAYGVKWYESYEGVACHEALMQLSKDWADSDETSNPYIGGAFARIGEEMEDVVEEVWGQGEYEWISVHRSMTCDWLD